MFIFQRGLKMNNLKVLKEKYILLLPPFILILLCFLALSFWNFSLKDKFSMSEKKVKDIENKLEEEKNLNLKMKRELKDWEYTSRAVEDFQKRLGTFQENMTKIIKEIEELSRKSGVVPHTYGFSYSEGEKKHFIRFQIVFPFEADYSNVRNFLHLLELTPSFITLNSINLNTAGEMSEKVNLQFRLTTYFSEEPK